LICAGNGASGDFYNGCKKATELLPKIPQIGAKLRKKEKGGIAPPFITGLSWRLGCVN
jgi:hypothetical protein